MRRSTLGKLLGFAALLAFTVGAVPAAASAAPAVLCKENVTKCASNQTYPNGTLFEATLKPETKLSFKNSALFSSALECGSSAMKGETLGRGGIRVSSLTFSSCTGPCPSPAVNRLPYSAGVEAGSSGNGTVRFKNGGSGEPTLQFSGCTFGTTCTYALSGASFRFEGGNPA